MKKVLNFSEALEAIKEGKMVRRCAWREDIFIFRQVPATIPLEVIPKMQCLPEAVKHEFDRRSKDETIQVSGIYYSNQLALVNSSNLIQSYSPSVADVLADDWELYGAI